MLNVNQINKIQKRVGEKVNAKIKEREDQLHKEKISNLKFIRNKINDIEKKNQNRGRCFCVWKNEVYTSKHNKAIRVYSINHESVKRLSLVDSKGDKNFYMMDEDTYRNEIEIIDWLKDYYAEIKLCGVRKNEPVFLLRLGEIGQKFTKNFPSKTLSDLVEYIKVMDFLIQRGE